MSKAIESETYVIHNSDGSVSLDPYARKTRAELKTRCRQLCRALDDWQHIAMTMAEHGKEGLSPDRLDELNRLIEAYKD